MNDNKESMNDDGRAGALQQLSIAAVDALVDDVSSLAGSALEEKGANRVNEFSLKVCSENLLRMAKDRSIVNAFEVEDVHDGVAMSPMIEAMLKACFLSLPVVGSKGSGTTWVVCAPTEQGKSVAAQFLVHGDHSMHPKRSLKIDATNMTNFARDFARYLQCSAAESCLSKVLCEALSDTVPQVTLGKVRPPK